MSNNNEKEKDIDTKDSRFGAYEREMERREQKQAKEKRKKKKIILKVILVILITLLVIVLAAGAAAWAFINGKLGQLKTETIDINNIGISDEVREELQDYRNIALLGIDSRADDYGTGNRSDCIIIASLNQKTGNIKLISVYRDTYVYVMENGTKRLDKITHAYSYGKAENALKSLNEALDLNIKKYVTVNFDAVVAAVDALGGVTIDIDSSELNYINDYIDATSQSSGIKSKHISKTGRQTVDGVQAVAYSRIRYTSGGDYKRTERMRTVVEAMMKKAKTLSIGQLNSFANTILPRISTNITSGDILGLIPSLASMSVDESIGWPYETKGITLDRWYGIPVTLESNVKKLHQDVFGQEDYEPSETVKEMSNAIIKKTGYTE